jgi:molybdopterin molybdotransferase
VATLSFEQARECVIREVANAQPAPTTEQVSLLESDGRVLAERIVADRDYPTLARSVRDGFAVRAADLPGELRVIGEVRAGERFSGEVRTGEAVEIMTGAPMPGGADSVVMIEHVTVSAGRVDVPRTLRPGENVSPQGSEAHQGDVLLEPGRRLGFAQIALAATVGCARLHVFRKPQVAIIATGDEIVDVGDTPLDHQIRNSNTQSLAVQVARAGGCPRILPVARDVYGVTRELVEQALQHDLVLLSGGVSAGKYDIVERVLADVGARFFFDRVLIQPGQPLVFGQARGKFFFGLPGNPASTMVTFEIFARAALQILRGECQPALELLWTRLAEDLRQKTGLTRFLPARVSADGSEVTPVKWQGSGDVSAQARANAYLVTDPDRESWAKGEWIRVLLK